MKKVYIETSIVSYLTARPSKNPVARAQQIIVGELFAGKLKTFNCFVSRPVIEEAALGDKIYAKKRLDICNRFPIIEPDEKSLKLQPAGINGR